jgi:hypothetical protein
MMRARLNSRLQRTQITGTSIVFPDFPTGVGADSVYGNSGLP